MKWLLVVLLFLSAEAFSKSKPLSENFSSYEEMRFRILSLISSAEKKVWVLSDLLTDGEFVASLYLAKYRKLDVSVLLAPEKANLFVSRLRDLRKQNIKTRVLPRGFQKGSPTVLIVDDNLVKVGTALDYRRGRGNYTLRYEKFTTLAKFQKRLNIAMKSSKRSPAGPKNRLQNRKVYGNQRSFQSVDGYVYGSEREPRPTGVADRLPAVTRSGSGAPRDVDQPSTQGE